MYDIIQHSSTFVIFVVFLSHEQGFQNKRKTYGSICCAVCVATKKIKINSSTYNISAPPPAGDGAPPKVIFFGWRLRCIPWKSVQLGVPSIFSSVFCAGSRLWVSRNPELNCLLITTTPLPPPPQGKKYTFWSDLAIPISYCIVVAYTYFKSISFSYILKIIHRAIRLCRSLLFFSPAATSCGTPLFAANQPPNGSHSRSTTPPSWRFFF